MRSVVTIVVGCLICASCVKSDDEKLQNMIADATKSTLFIPESYDPISFDCDSLMNDVFSDVNIRKATKFVEFMNEAKDLKRDMEFNAEQCDFWRGKYGGFYNDYSRKKQKAQEKLDNNLGEARNIAYEIRGMYFCEPELKGYVVNHRFRAKNNFGNVCFGETIFILNKEKDKIIYAFSLEDEKVLYFLQLLAGLRDIGNKESIEDADLFDLSHGIKSKFELQCP